MPTPHIPEVPGNMDPGKREHGRAEWKEAGPEGEECPHVFRRFRESCHDLLALLPPCRLWSFVGCQGEIAISQLSKHGLPDQVRMG